LAGIITAVVIEIIKRRKPEMRSIVMTGYTVSRIDDPAALDAPLRAIDIEVDDYLEKPFEIKTLLTSIDNIRQRGKNPVSAWLDRFKASQDEQGRQLLRKHRYSAWNFFRVAVRSRHFVVGRIRPVLRIWDVLEEIELDYLKALNGEDEVSSIRLKELAKKYADFLFFTRQRLTAGGLLEPAPRQPGMMTPEALKGLVLKIQNEVITVEELHLAVHCWRLPPAMLGDNPFIERIHHRLWN
ncbi:hypothetical protein IV102_05750, partial [bacterium]|nr:hypothetical protein [bacterium]